MRWTVVVLVAIALASAGLLAGAHGLGWRDDVGFLTFGDGDPRQGALYIVAWLQAWIVAPIAALAACIAWIGDRVGRA